MPLALNLRRGNSSVRRPIRGREVTFPGSNERVVNDKGDLNASNNKELLKNIAMLLEGAANGSIDLANDNDNTKTELTAAEKTEMLKAAYESDPKNSPVWGQLGQSLAADIDLTVQREGFMRLLLERNEVTGRVAQIRTRFNNVTAVVMTTPSMLAPQYVISQWVTAPEFDIVANVLVAGNDINMDGEDLLQEKYDDGLQSFIVGEDRAWKSLADAVVGTEIPLKIFTGAFAPNDLLDMQAELISRGVNPSTVVMHLNYWRYFLGSDAFSNWFDPATKYMLLQTGQIGTLLGLTFITDGYRQANMQVLEPGEIYMVGAPNQHGGYTDRGPIMAVPTDTYNQGLDARGWFMKERMSMAIVNPGSVVKGRKA
jgi:hypothetical protein